MRLTAAIVVLLVTVHATPPIILPHYGLCKLQRDVEVPRWTLVGKWFREHAREGESLAAAPIGAVSYYSGLTVIDMLGLTNEHIAHRTMPNMGEGWAGHEKYDGQYVLSRKPTYLLLGNIYVTTEPRDPQKVPFITYASRRILEREQDMYDSDLITTMYRPCIVELAPGQFLNFYQLKDQYR